MPCLSAPDQNPQTILVTGANGYIAMRTIYDLLLKGFGVIGTVRSSTKGDNATDALRTALGPDNEPKLANFRYVVVEDIIEPGVFDDVIQGVYGVMHMAAVLNSTSEDPSAYIIPAVDGTLNVMRSALHHGHLLKRVVLTSSCAAVVDSIDSTSKVFTESDWGDTAVAIVERDGAKANGGDKYRAAKTLSERAARTFVKDHLDELKWDLVVLNPSLVIGPPVHTVNSLPDAGPSLSTWYRTMRGENKAYMDRFRWGYAYVDVRDVSDAQINALLLPEAGNERFIISAGTATWGETGDIIKTIRPHLESKFPVTTATVEQDPRRMRFDGSKAESILRITYRDIQTSVGDTLDDFGTRGFH